MPAIKDYVQKRRMWYKAEEVIIEIVAKVNDEQFNNTKERNTFRHQFILNYLNKTGSRMKKKFIRDSVFALNQIGETGILNCIKNVLKLKGIKIEND